MSYLEKNIQDFLKNKCNWGRVKMHFNLNKSILYIHKYITLNNMNDTS